MPDHTILNSSVTLAVALCGMVAAILVPYITGKQQMALTLAILNAQQHIAVEQAKNATETTSILRKVDGRLTAALDARAAALEQVSAMAPKDIVAKTLAQAARKEAVPPPEKPK